MAWLAGFALCTASLQASEVTGVDGVTMGHGGVDRGTGSHESCVFATDCGQLSVPYGWMEELDIGDGHTPDRLVTRFGDEFHGRVQDRQFTMLRAVETALRLNMADVVHISFAARPLPLPERDRGAVVDMENDGRFFARINASDFTLEQDDGELAVSSRDIERIDFAHLMDGEEHRVQVRLTDGRLLQGRLSQPSLQVATLDGQSLELPLTAVSALVYRLDQQQGRPLSYCRTAPPRMLLRDTFADGTAGPELAVLPGGAFLRGDLQGDGDDDEKPPLPVTVRPFAIAVFEVTFDEYDRFCDDTRCSRPDDGGWGRGQRPVINVSWNEAVAYTDWLSRKTGKRYRLPTDAEWEYAARAGTASRYWWGDEAGVARANCDGCASLWDGEQTAAVGRFPANAFGLHDTAGNVFEWVADCHDSSFAEVPRDISAPDKAGCGKRVIRGGAWSFPPKEVRSANRWRDFPSRHSDDTGFRVVRELDAGEQ